MSLQDTQPTRQALAAKDRSAPLRVTGKLKTAIEAMVWDGACREDAAKVAGMTDHSLRAALRKPHVKRHYLMELDVLRTSARARATFRMVELSEQDDNRAAAVTATRILMNEQDQEVTRGSTQAAPGLVVVIQQAHDMAHVGNMPAKPLIEHDPDSER